MKTCAKCSGTGKFGRGKCFRCEGKGELTLADTLRYRAWLKNNRAEERSRTDVDIEDEEDLGLSEIYRLARRLTALLRDRVRLEA